MSDLAKVVTAVLAYYVIVSRLPLVFVLTASLRLEVSLLDFLHPNKTSFNERLPNTNAKSFTSLVTM